MTRGYFAFVLHCHIPYVLSHGRWPHGSDWLCEAAAETYLPILKLVESLRDEVPRPLLTLDFSPILCEQLASAQFKQEFKIYLDQRMSAAEHDLLEFAAEKQSVMSRTAAFWMDFYQRAKDQLASLGDDILAGFRRLQDEGAVEILTCGATHGYFPLLSRDETIRAQIRLAVANYRKHFGRPPKGIWLPECGYRPAGNWLAAVPMTYQAKPRFRVGVDDLVAESGLDFFIAAGVDDTPDASAAMFLKTANRPQSAYVQQPGGSRYEYSSGSSPRNVFVLQSKHHTGSSVKFFVRDPETGLIVWSGEHGYPGDANYLEFHKRRFPSGHRYWAVTSPKSDLGDKTEYFRNRALEKTEEHAVHFVNTIAGVLNRHRHWWFEGPEFLAHVLRKIKDSEGIEITGLSDFAASQESVKPADLLEGSWGMGGNHYVWMNEQTAWTWPIIYAAEEKMLTLMKAWRAHPDRQAPEIEAVLKQAARELLLLTASDWQFLITTNSARDYAERRFRGHARDFSRLAELVGRMQDGTAVDDADRLFLTQCLQRDGVFEEISLDWFV